MATRQDYQIAIDVCRFANIVNDLLDVCAYVARNIDPNNGDVTTLTVEEIKAQITEHIASVNLYYATLTQYIDGLTVVRIQAALLAWDINAQNLRDDLVSMRDVATVISNQLPTITTFAELENGATYIDNNVPKLPLFRRRWDL